MCGQSVHHRQPKFGQPVKYLHRQPPGQDVHHLQHRQLQCGQHVRPAYATYSNTDGFPIKYQASGR